jgi:hypothetical protein
MQKYEEYKDDPGWRLGVADWILEECEEMLKESIIKKVNHGPK